MPGARDHLDQQAYEVTRSRGATPSPEAAERPAITTADDPRLTRAGAGAQADLMRVQRTAGNAATASLVAPTVQRVVTTDDPSAEATAPPATAPGGETAAGEATGTPAGPEADHTITAGHIGLNAPMVEASGVLRAQTVVADSIVATSYTPGVGNQW